MDNLALAYVTCDKYSHVWHEWFSHFMQHWSIDMPKYFLGEEKECPWDGWTSLPYERVEADKWTTKLRAQIEKIPERNIFVWLDDLVPQKNITTEFTQAYSLFRTLEADSFRIMPRASASKVEAVPFSIGRHQVHKLRQGPYMVSFHPNIFTKRFLLDALKYDESPWDCELKSQYRVMGRDIYTVQIDGWLSNEIIKGV